MDMTFLIGAQLGDEGKRKIADYLCRKLPFDYAVRYNGGNNAGGTVVHNGVTHKLHLVPGGVLEGAVGVIAGGVAADPEVLWKEIERFGLTPETLRISKNAHMILPEHKFVDEVMEENRSKPLGTTKRGVGPCYADKSYRNGFRFGELKQIRASLENKLRVLRNSHGIGNDESYFTRSTQVLRDAKDNLERFVCDADKLVRTEALNGSAILMEGAQSVMLGIDHGDYPYVTSSSSLPSAGMHALGIQPNSPGIERVRTIGVFKAYTTRVGPGPFPTEMDEEDNERTRDRGKEYGTTTGRPRNCGWLDLVALKHAVELAGIEELALTKPDVLGGFDRVKACVQYINAKGPTEKYPNYINEKLFCTPTYETFPGWPDHIGKKLDPNLISFIEFVEDFVGVNVSIVSYGPDTNQTVELD